MEPGIGVLGVGVSGQTDGEMQHLGAGIVSSARGLPLRINLLAFSFNSWKAAPFNSDDGGSQFGLDSVLPVESCPTFSGQKLRTLRN